MKTHTRYILLSICLILIFLVMPSRWSYLIFGTIAFIIGSAVLTEEWKTGKRVNAIVFIIAITVGGLLTTNGWNEWGSYSQKKVLITALAREWMNNELYQKFPSLSFDPNDPNLGVIANRYKPFKTSAFESILTSNLFDLQNKDDRKLCLEAMTYELSAASCNEWFDAFNWDMTRKGSTWERRKNMYKNMIGSSQYVGFKESHENIGKLLKENYSWALKDALLFFNEKAQKELREKYKWLQD